MADHPTGKILNFRAKPRLVVKKKIISVHDLTIRIFIYDDDSEDYSLVGLNENSAKIESVAMFLQHFGTELLRRIKERAETGKPISDGPIDTE